MKFYHALRQGRNESVTDYTDRFNAAIRFMEYYGASISDNVFLLQHELRELGQDPAIITYANHSTADIIHIAAAKLAVEDKFSATFGFSLMSVMARKASSFSSCERFEANIGSKTRLSSSCCISLIIALTATSPCTFTPFLYHNCVKHKSTIYL